MVVREAVHFMVSFRRFDLRTTNAESARAFYARVLGHDRSVIWPLHEEALARGARPHWLGSLGTEDAGAVVASFVARGAARLGPPRPLDGGGQGFVLRDPGGAIVGVTSAPHAHEETRGPGVVWHVLNTDDAPSAERNYEELFHWALGERLARGEEGMFREFAWVHGEAPVGLIGDIAGRPGVHPHWLFFFEVDDLHRALAEVRAGGGLALEPRAAPSGALVCVCDDQEGAAFGLLQSSLGRPRRRS